jgi:ubiquinone/menaquinone biosynthesis methyltransferase
VTLRSALTTPAAKRRYVRWLFETIAPRYDCITVVLSYGQDRRWKRRLVDLAAPRPGTRALDLACGTGDLAFELARRGAVVVGLDLVPRMIALARARAARAGDLPSIPRFLVGDMSALPFPAASFDLVTTGYGLRNVPVLDTALAEIRRVLAPGGWVWSLDFDRPARAWLRTVYLGYLTVVGTALGFALHGRGDTYRYIPATIRRYIGAAQLARRMAALGFEHTAAIPVFGGLMAINTGRVPADP